MSASSSSIQPSSKSNDNLSSAGKSEEVVGTVGGEEDEEVALVESRRWRGKAVLSWKQQRWQAAAERTEGRLLPVLQLVGVDCHTRRAEADEEDG